VLLLLLAFSTYATQCATSAEDAEMPSPFTRVLCYNRESNLMSGSDVVILQNLIIRSPYVNATLPLTGEYDYDTYQSVIAFQAGNQISGDPSGVFGPDTANMLLSLHSCDGYKDLGIPAKHYGAQYLYKLHFQVFNNRSYETIGSLFDANNLLLHQFRLRTHGWDNATANPPWPYWSNTDGLNMFTSNGNTPTGLAEADLNSPEDDDAAYGPFPVNRMINGIEGNVKFILEKNAPIRSGVLLHTGMWRLYSDWNLSMEMPNSEGCIHAHPADIEQIWQKLISIGVQVRPNPGGVVPYPYQPQGLFSVEQVGCQ